MNRTGWKRDVYQRIHRHNVQNQIRCLCNVYLLSGDQQKARQQYNYQNVLENVRLLVYILHYED